MKKPIPVLRFASGGRPGFLSEFLEAKRIPFETLRIHKPEDVPGSAHSFPGLIIMGGPMSVNDDLQWIEPVLTLIRNALSEDVPVLGICLGAQLMARALDATVQPSPMREMGWGEVEVVDNGFAHALFSPHVQRFPVFHFHNETFSLPAGTTHLLRSVHCEHQAFALGNSLALQCHVEPTAEMVKKWTLLEAPESPLADHPHVQTREQILDNLPTRIAALHAAAEPIFTHWVCGLRR